MSLTAPGVSISASFLLIIAIINLVILVRAIRARRRARQQARVTTGDESEIMDKADTPEDVKADPNSVRVDELPRGEGAPPPQSLGLLTRLCRPLLRLIDRPYKMYAVGLCFGLGFDTVRRSRRHR